jgi:polyhydroxyalkanoate synthase
MIDNGREQDGARRTGTSLVRRVQAKVDPLGFVPATVSALGRAAGNPGALVAAGVRLALGVGHAAIATAGTAASVPIAPPIPADPADRRFIDDAWEHNAYFFAVRQLYGLACRYLDDVLDAGQNSDTAGNDTAGNDTADEDVADKKAAMACHLVTEALAPTNYPLTNPTVMTRAFSTGGHSLVRGMRLAVRDVVAGDGMPVKVDRSAFTVGQDLAATPGSVVYRNELIELIQYRPQSEKVHAVPMLVSPPWINKYYVLDLAPKRSFVEWAVQHNRTVFMISYRNPDESMSDYTMDDYLEQGVLEALEVVQRITDSDKVDTLGLCLGGAMATFAAAHLAARAEDRLGSLTLLNTMLDYSAPGDLSAFVDDETLDRIEIRMREHGYLDSADMARAFDLLRARDMIFRYIPQRWLMGEEAPPFDILAWNEDATRMPSAMHTTYLRSLYGQNLLAAGKYDLAGERLDLGAILNDSYVVGAINDHIVPWTSSFAATHLLGGDVRYVLSSGGHIAGAVNPPSPKAWMESTADATSAPSDPRLWRQAATRESSSWWTDWIEWSSPRAGDLIAAPERLGTKDYPVLEDAPGTYVLG